MTATQVEEQVGTDRTQHEHDWVTGSWSRRGSRVEQYDGRGWEHNDALTQHIPDIGPYLVGGPNWLRPSLRPVVFHARKLQTNCLCGENTPSQTERYT